MRSRKPFDWLAWEQQRRTSLIRSGLTGDLAERLAHVERLGRERIVKVFGQREALRAELVMTESGSLAFELVEPRVPEAGFYRVLERPAKLRRR